ncbi:MAG: EF-hand domain-containing protein, partial [Planctomycetota bacterium]|nr:EF-hand domain-containing protein [Planctomycetota bacterium]
GGSSMVTSLGGALDVFGQLRTASNASADLSADSFRLGSRGILTARTGSSLTINAPVANLDGQTRLEQNASMTFAGSATAIGPTTANLNASLTAGGTFTNLDTFTITSGTISAPLFFNRDAANIFGTSALFGSYTNDAGATTTIRSGTLFVFGSLTNNGTIVGTICAGCAGSPPTLDLTGSLVLGPDANLTMPFVDALVRLGGNFDAAINNNTRYDMARAILQLEGTGAPQTLEAMSLDRGQDPTALDRTIAGNFPIGTLRVGPNPSLVRTVDTRDNDGQPGCEAIYVDTLIIEAGSTLDTSACVTIYYNTLVNNGTVTDETKLVPIEPCAADFDGSGFLDSDDFVFYLDQFTLGCVGPGEDVFGANPSCVKSADFDQSGFVDVDDFVAYLAAFEVGC